jgi:hypothetical protein
VATVTSRFAERIVANRQVRGIAMMGNYATRRGGACEAKWIFARHLPHPAYKELHSFESNPSAGVEAGPQRDARAYMSASHNVATRKQA